MPYRPAGGNTIFAIFSYAIHQNKAENGWCKDGRVPLFREQFVCQQGRCGNEAAFEKERIQI